MTPIRFARALLKANSKPCGNCKNCPCRKTEGSKTSTPTVFDMDSFEYDPSPLATQTIKFFEELEAKKAATSKNFWEDYCELNASDPECKTYEV